MKKYLDRGHYLQIAVLVWIAFALFQTLAMTKAIGADINSKPKALIGVMMRSYSDKIETQKQELKQKDEFIAQLKTKLENSNDLLNKCDKNLFIPN